MPPQMQAGSMPPVQPAQMGVIPQAATDNMQAPALPAAAGSPPTLPRQVPPPERFGGLPQQAMNNAAPQAAFNRDTPPGGYTQAPLIGGRQMPMPRPEAPGFEGRPKVADLATALRGLRRRFGNG